MSSATRPARADRWFVNTFRDRAASASLYCFPFAGGSASYYLRWARCFTGDIELVPVQLPGRDTRRAEPPSTSIAAVADDVAELIATVPTQPLLFGHSMGAIIAFEVARRLDGLGRSAGHLFVSGRPAPPIARPQRVVSSLPRAEFLQVLRDYGAATDEILHHRELLDLLIPTMRADFSMIEGYTYVDAPPLSCPILGWCGDSDPDVTPATMTEWARQTTGPFGLISCSGGHFFLSDHYPEVARAMHRAAQRAR